MYNRCAIFLCPSTSEGWGLPSTEAMQCQCALVTAENGGHRDFAFDGRTALTTPAADSDALARAISCLLTDSKTRVEIAKSGHAWVQQFTWKRATDSLEALLREMA